MPARVGSTCGQNVVATIRYEMFFYCAAASLNLDKGKVFCGLRDLGAEEKLGTPDNDGQKNHGAEYEDEGQLS